MGFEMKKIIFITPSDARYGFELAGAEQYVAGGSEIEDLLEKFLSEKETGVVIIDERLAADIPDEKLRILEEKWFGIVLILPSPEDTIEESKDPLTRLLKKTLGYYMRIK
jgi:V/A-type H+-transporting ATPase subunit F